MWFQIILWHSIFPVNASINSEDNKSFFESIYPARPQKITVGTLSDKKSVVLTITNTEKKSSHKIDLIKKGKSFNEK